MQQNLKFKKFREDRNLTQLELAKKLDISRSLIADIERGSTGISKRVMSKIVKIFDIESGYFNQPLEEKNNEIKQGAEIGLKQGFKGIKRAYRYKFADFIKNTHPEYYQFSKDVINILSITEIIDQLNDTTLADFIFHSTDNLMKDKSYNEFKNRGLEKYKEAFKHKEIIHEFAQACRKFAISLSKIKEEIKLDYDFEDYLNE